LIRNKKFTSAKPTKFQYLFDRIRHRERFEAMNEMPELNKKQIDLLSELKKNGYVILNNHIDKNKLKILKLEFNNALNEMKFKTPCLAQSKINNIKHADLLNKNLVATPEVLTQQGLAFQKEDCSNYNQVVDDFNPSTLTVPMLEYSDLFVKTWLDESILGLVAYYMGMVPQLVEAYVRRNFPAPYRTMNHYWHRDLNHHSYLLKALFFLNDCNMTTGPNEYVKGSCINKKQLNILNGQQYYTDNEVDTFYPPNSSERALSIVPAGTVIIEDTRGLHRANMPQSNYRDVGYAVFTPTLKNSPALYKIPPELFKNTTELQRLFIPEQVARNN